jgi:hypothetical protein
MAAQGMETVKMTATARAIPELSVDTQTIERLLWDVPVGEVISYETLSKAIGRDVQRRARHILTSAVRRVQREKQMVFAAVNDVGLKRLSDSGVIGVGAQAVVEIGRKSRRTVKKLACAKYEALSKDEQTQHNVLVSQLGMLAHVTSANSQKKLEAKVEEAQAKLPVAKMLDAIRATL